MVFDESVLIMISNKTIHFRLNHMPMLAQKQKCMNAFERASQGIQQRDRRNNFQSIILASKYVSDCTDYTTLFMLQMCQR